MRKLMLWLGRVPASIRQAARRARKITTPWIAALESERAVMLTKIIPTDIDETLRLSILAILKALQPALQAVDDTKARKAIAARAGAEIVAIQDGHKERLGQYAIWFEQVYQEDTKNPSVA